MADTYVRPAADIKQEILKLTSVDLALVNRFYFHIILCLKLDSSTDSKKVFADLVTGLSHTLSDIPFFAGRVVPAHDGRRYQVVVGSDAGVTFKFHDCTSSKTTSPVWTYEQLERAHFPTTILDSVLPLPDLYREDDQGEPVVHLEAKFLDGGLLLLCCMHHATSDNFSWSRFVRTWASYTKGAASGWTYAPPKFPAAALDRSSLYMTATSFQPDEWPEFSVVPPPAAPRPSLQAEAKAGTHPTVNPDEKPSIYHLPPSHAEVVTTWWYLSARSLQEIKNIAQPTDPADPRISTNDALIALIWRRGTVARHVVEKGFASSTLWVPINFRPRLDLHPDYMGNGAILAAVTCPATELTSAEPDAIYQTASRIRREVSKFDAHKIRCTLTAWESALPAQSVYNINVPGPDTCVSSILNFDWYDHDWGCHLGRIACLRYKPAGSIEGFATVNPRFRDGGCEIMLMYEAEATERLKDDKEFTRFAEFRCN